jgi:hypothetical protein
MFNNMKGQFSIKSLLSDHLKNLIGWKTSRKIVIFSVDDYGNVRIDSREAREKLSLAGLNDDNRFDQYDALETVEDLEILFETLRSVKDKNGRSAVFTPYAIPCNIDFERMAETGWQTYYYELLPQTFEKLSARHPRAYEGTWQLWQQGMKEGLLRPQFHGREHFNLKFFNRKLVESDRQLRSALKERSLVSISGSGYLAANWTAAFSFWDLSDLDNIPGILREGLSAFEQVFSYPATVFTPPAQQFHPSLYPFLQQLGIRAVDRPFLYRQHFGLGKFKHKLEWLRYDRSIDLTVLVRNVVFEPTDGEGDHVSKALRQIEVAFRLNRPVNISSHRINFCGQIDPANRSRGIKALKDLLREIKKRWPDVEFRAADELAALVFDKS